MKGISTKIIQGEIPSYRIAENEKFYAFLDINPLAKGHTLVIPKKEINYIFDIADDTLAEMIVFAKKVGLAVEANIPCKRIGLAVLGLEVPHAHIHLIPINSVFDIDFKQEKLKLEASEFEEISKSIRLTYEKNN